MTYHLGLEDDDAEDIYNVLQSIDGGTGTISSPLPATMSGLGMLYSPHGSNENFFPDKNISGGDDYDVSGGGGSGVRSQSPQQQQQVQQQQVQSYDDQGYDNDTADDGGGDNQAYFNGTENTPWDMFYDESSGAYYYYNNDNGESSWEEPEVVRYNRETAEGAPLGATVLAPLTDGYNDTAMLDYGSSVGTPGHSLDAASDINNDYGYDYDQYQYQYNESELAYGTKYYEPGFGPAVGKLFCVIYYCYYCYNFLYLY